MEKDTRLQLRMSKERKQAIKEQALKSGFEYPIDYILDLIDKDMREKASK